MSNSPSSSQNPSIKEMDWYAIACKIRSQNQKLKQKVADLEAVIEEQKQQIKVQVIKNQDSESLINEQEEIKLELENEISEYEEEIRQKEEQIETQQSTISELVQELEKIQQQTARLERECSLLQENYNDQQNKLKQVEAENKDLRIRLQRQQRYNLQYKTALDQFLDTSSQNNRDFDSLGIKSWSENDTEVNAMNGTNGFASVEPITSGWQEEDSDDSETQLLSSESTASETFDSQPEEPKEEQKEEPKPHRGKLFLKLPQFGNKKKNEKE